MSVKHMCRLFVITLVIQLCQPVQAKVYQWTDDQGVKHFSNVAPPLEGPVKTMEETAGQKKGAKVQMGAKVFKGIRAYDGDTLLVAGDGVRFKVRLVGIDAPESGRNQVPDQPFAKAAAQSLSQWTAGRSLRLKLYGTDAYNRVLAEVFHRGKNLNLDLVSQGLAEVYQGRPAPGFNPAPYHRAQTIAKAAKKGIWSQGDAYESPRAWRKKHPLK